MDVSLSKLTYLDWITAIAFLLAFAFFLNPKLERNRLWRATVIPLASIIGSGYLVCAPLLYYAVGDYAVLAMAGIVTLAYLIGTALRFNIRYAEPLIYEQTPERKLHIFLVELERFSNLVLAFSYIISVAFYLRLLSAFIFSGFFHRDPFLENLLTTALLLFIGISGFLKGLDFLAFLDRYGVAINLSIIFSFLVGLAVHDLTLFEKHFSFEGTFKPITFETLQILAGILLIVQGFETSKYLKEKFTVEERIKSMRLAQIISGFIYVTFILLITPLFHLLNNMPLSATAIIVLAASLSLVLGFLIKVGPLVSQFSAAVADTASAGGLLYMETHGRISSNLGYLLLALIDIVLIWSANIFQIIAYASKSFAFYYMLQTVIAFIVALKYRKYHLAVLFFVLIWVLAFITVFGKSAE
ncbi:MAG: hypothetical protein GXN97_03425 [Aquificae bacterium]|jgi:hypothetical protein|nr:hypothetical protein [Aquificota bacterium]